MFDDLCKPNPPRESFWEPEGRAYREVEVGGVGKEREVIDGSFNVDAVDGADVNVIDVVNPVDNIDTTGAEVETEETAERVAESERVERVEKVEGSEREEIMGKETGSIVVKLGLPDASERD